ncbi:MAG: TIGR04150 pseudo-rSAM protein [Candidatus Aminicenantes bacterium]|nr:TIGR04150 pseudo-rSAM protein [Candidatus Aminicenantes bacterium]NIM83051.1 TIGR04150 pseudo-rSAM protein [Candidatus Aminicenantes bacterium]NIN22430.1 TIGR04150 pseudo-rSAM protein [Candidatus Aminicenantes bacterium]NIN46198.1 TIGR04150 pseudo-rSAM protein [Candidatus Aminicenantes bacterium]NIN89035.1 TIGR04150 pseudo-rSAM protein [Candidatus Aminicenantes bacterium]
MTNSNKKQYWFYIDSYVHISMKNRDVLFYNTYSGKFLEYTANQNGDAILKLTRKLLSPKNLRVIRLTSEHLDNQTVSGFVRSIREYFMGDLIETRFSDSKPPQVVPTRPKIHVDVKNALKDPDVSFGNIEMIYMYEITIYLNDSCRQKCPECVSFYKQGVWCRKGKNGGHNLDIPLLKNLFHEITGSRLKTINITGGNILLYPYWEELYRLFNPLDCRVHFFINYLNIDDQLEPLKRVKEIDHQVRLLVHFPLEIDRFKQSYETLSGYGLKIKPVFFVQSDEEYSVLEEMLSTFPLESPVFLPYYNQKNLDFFKKNFFVNREDIEARKPGFRIIHGNSCINMDNFGKLVILPNGHVHANVMDPVLGILGNDSIYDIMFKEMKTGRSWFKLRKNSLPCKKCNFDLLCPPLSNYNRVIGQNNLCFIRENP